MLDLAITDEQADVTLRALHTLAKIDGDLEAHEASLLRAVGRALGRPWEGLSPITPEEAAAALPAARPRERLVQSLELLALLDGKVVPAEVELVEQFAAALEVDEPRLRNLRQLHRRSTRLLQMDLMRRSPMGDMVKRAWDTGGVRGLWRFAAAPYGYTADPELAWRFKELGLLPEGTLGRTYWAHMTARRFAFPGEPTGLPEELVCHDLCHVLSGYDTDVPGECQNAAFISGFLREDPFSYVFMVAVHCHLDIEVFPNDPSRASMSFDPELVVPAFQRGSKVKRDLYDPAWHWWDDMPRPIDELRAELGIEPL